MEDLGERRRFPKAARWPSVAAAALGAGWEVIPEGQPGRSTVLPDPIEGEHKSGRSSLLAILESHRPLDLVAIMLGTNDLKHRFRMTAEDIAFGVERLGHIVKTSATGPGQGVPQLLLIAPVPVIEVGRFTQIFAGATETSRWIAPHLEAAAERLGAAFLDAGAVSGAEVDPVDGIHLTEAAHAALGQAVAHRVQEIYAEA